MNTKTKLATLAIAGLMAASPLLMLNNASATYEVYGSDASPVQGAQS